MTLQAKLLNYAGVAAVTKGFALKVLANPCTISTINAADIPAMTLTIGDAQTVADFIQMTDSEAIL